MRYVLRMRWVGLCWLSMFAGGCTMLCGLSGPPRSYPDPEMEAETVKAEPSRAPAQDAEDAATAVTVVSEPPRKEEPAPPPVPAPAPLAEPLTVSVPAPPPPPVPVVPPSDGRAVIDEEATAAVFADRMKPADLIDQVEDLLDKDRVMSARVLVRRHIDVAVETLRRSTLGSASNTSALHLIASEYDRLCLNDTKGISGYQEALVHYRGNSGSYRKFRENYRDLVRNQTADKHEEVSGHDLTAALPKDAPVLIRIEACRLMGIFYRVSGDTDRAVTVLEQGVSLAGRDYPYESADLRLHMAEVYWRSGQSQQAGEWWLAALETAGDLLTRKTPCCDPIFWQRVMQLKPTQAVWPAQLTSHLRQLAVVQYGLQFAELDPPYPPDGISVEWLVWDRLGHWYLGRGQPRAALVAWHNAELVTRASQGKALAQVGQARALIEMGQHSTATKLLSQATRHDYVHAAAQAEALLGVAQIRRGEVRDGLTRIRNVAAEDQLKDWPGRADAEADMGLAYLLIDNEEAGLHWLHAAQKRFAATGEYDKQIAALKNEARYYEHTGQGGKAGDVRRAIEDIESP